METGKVSYRNGSAGQPSGVAQPRASEREAVGVGRSYSWTGTLYSFSVFEDDWRQCWRLANLRHPRSTPLRNRLGHSIELTGLEGIWMFLKDTDLRRPSRVVWRHWSVVSWA